MADTKITALAAIGANPINVATFPIPMVDLLDNSMAASGTTKKVTVNQILGAGGTATLASATITGDLTVDTSTLKVDSTNNRVGIGTASPSAPLHTNSDGVVSGAGWTAIGRFNNVAQSKGVDLGYNPSNSNAVLSALTAGATSGFEFWTFDGSWSNRMTLNANGLGVGVSPSYKIHSVVTSGYAGAFKSSTAVVGGILCGNTLGDLIVAVDASGNGRLTADASKYLGLGSGGINDRVILDSSGNVGIGVTPSAWLAGVKALDIGSSGLAAYSGGITHNAYFDNTDSRWEYKGTGAATFYNPQNGIHQWFVAASGTANNPITTFANAAMTLDASGNLILLSSNTPATLTTNGQLTVNATSNTNLRFSYRGSDGVTRTANLTLA